MSDLLLQLMYFVRPLTMAQFGVSIMGLSLFEVFAGVLVGVLLVAYLFSKPALTRGVDLLDGLMIAFIFWCIFITFVQSETSDWKWTLRWSLPLVIYILLRRMIRTEKAFLRHLRVMLIGFFILDLANAVTIFSGWGRIVRDYVTGIERFDGIFNDVHTMGHTVGFSLMLAAIYFGLQRAALGPKAYRQTPGLTAMAAAMVPLCMYGLVRGNVRTVLVGLVVFIGIFLLMTNRRQLILFIGTLIVVWVTSTFVETIFWDVKGRTSTQGESVEMAGSGRPWIWLHNLDLYGRLPLEDKITGVGVGNEVGVFGANGIITYELRNRAWASHNDFLSSLMQLGIVGFVLLISIYVTWFRLIRRLTIGSKVLYMSLFGAVVIMNFLSNSYLTRFGLGQLLSMVMIGIHIAPATKAVRLGHETWRVVNSHSVAGRGRARES